MPTHTAQHGFGFDLLRGVLHLPQRTAQSASEASSGSTARTDWLERLANWAERQPMHHRMGSYTLLR